jgi:phenylalanyl-tRNA synthetase alpha subunit
MLLTVQTSPGEFLDKLTILEIKSERIQDPEKVANVRRELELLKVTWAGSPLATRDVTALTGQLREVNEILWDVEDRIRLKEAEQRFDADFIELARAVYRTNDKRAAIKRRINVALGSEILEEKSYAGSGG